MHLLTVAAAAAAVSALSATTLCAQGDLLYTVTSVDGLLRTVDPLLATTVASVPIVRSTGGNAIQCNGLARDPVTGQVWAIVRFAGSAARHLCALNLQTGVATSSGALPDNFAGLAFRIDGMLFGVTGDGAATPETLYTLNPANAQATLVMALGAGNDGETIGFAPDLMLYHASGLGVPNTDEVFERIDTFTNTVTNVPLSGYDYDELLAITSYTGGSLLAVDLNDEYFEITTSGHVAFLGAFDHGFVKGMVFVPSPASQGFFRPYGDGCATAAGPIPLLIGTGTPTQGQAVGLHLRLAPGVTFGLFAAGFGNGALPFPSAACQVQINPVFFSTGFVTGGLGEFDFTLPFPAVFPPIDLWFQAGALDGANFVVSNPLAMHMQ